MGASQDLGGAPGGGGGPGGGADLRTLALLGAASGDKALQPFGHALAAEYSPTAIQTRALKAAQEQRLQAQADKMDAEEAAIDSPESQAVADQLAASAGLPKGIAARLLLNPKGPLEIVRKMQEVQQGKYRPLQDSFGNTIGLLDTKTGNVQRLGLGGSGGGMSGSGMSEDALNNAADYFAKTGQIPPGMARGKGAAQIALAIQNRAAERNPNLDLAGNKAGYGANAKSLATAQTTADRIDAFETTALRNLDLMLQTAKGRVETGSPLLNRPVQEAMRGIFGDTGQTKWITARQVAVQEIAKILSGAMGNAGVTEGARRGADALLPANATLQQIMAAADILKQDMHNRKQAAHDQIALIQGRASGRPADPSVQPAPEAAPKRKKWNPATGTLE